MKKTSKAVLVVSGSSLLVGLLGWVLCWEFFAGTASGPDFVQAVRSGSVSADTISSIEVVEPAIGHTPFTAKEYAGLAPRTRIDSPDSIERFVTFISAFQPGRIDQNHPTESYQVYLRVNDAGGFFWLYGSVHQDSERAVFLLDANTRNAVNPNGGDTYHLDNFSELLASLQQKTSTE